MKNLFTPVLVAFLAGCAAKVPPNTGHPSEWWQPSGSPCMDALQINQIAEGCPEMEVNHIEPAWLELRCTEGLGNWSNGMWLWTPTGYEPLPGYMPVCIDEFGLLSVRQN